MNPLVSIIIPTLNRLQFIEETVKSVSEQTYKNIEIIISDNGSTCDVKEHIHKFTNDPRIVFRRNNKTIPTAYHFNQCLNIAKGKYIIYISDDDIISDNFIQMMVNKFESDNSISIGIAETQIIDINGQVVNTVAESTWVKKDGKDFLYNWLLDRESIPVASFISLFARVSSLKLMDGFPDFDNASHMDNVIAINLCLMGGIVFVKEATFFYRVYNSSFGLSVSIKSLFIASHQFINYYKNNNGKLDRINKNQVDIKKLILGIKNLSFTTYIYRLIQVYRVKNLNLIKAICDYGLGYYELYILMKIFSSKIIKYKKAFN